MRRWNLHEPCDPVDAWAGRLDSPSTDRGCAGFPAGSPRHSEGGLDSMQCGALCCCAATGAVVGGDCGGDALRASVAAGVAVAAGCLGSPSVASSDSSPAGVPGVGVAGQTRQKPDERTSRGGRAMQCARDKCTLLAGGGWPARRRAGAFAMGLRTGKQMHDHLARHGNAREAEPFEGQSMTAGLPTLPATLLRSG